MLSLTLNGTPKPKSLQELERIADANESDVQKVQRCLYVRAFASVLVVHAFLLMDVQRETRFARDRALRGGVRPPPFFGCSAAFHLVSGCM